MTAMTSPERVRSGWPRRLNAHGVEPEDLLLLSSTNAPDEMGSDADHKKGQWFQELWEYATASRSDPTIHIRGVHYATVMRDEEIKSATPCRSWTVYQNTKTCFDYLKSASKAARVLGYVPMDAIVDEKNTQRRLLHYGEHSRDPDPQSVESLAVVQAPDIPHVKDQARLRFEDPEDVIDHVAARTAEQLADQLYLDRERSQPYHIELWSEKTLPSDVVQTARRVSVNATVQGQGDLSYTVANDFVQRVNSADKPAIVLYLSDFDPVGSNMANAMAAKLCWLNRADRLKHRAMVKRLAVTAEQVEKYGLPREFISTGDVPEAYKTRIEDWQDEHGEGIVELNALEADIDLFRTIIREGVSQYRDPDLTAKQEAAIDEWQASAEAAIRETLQDRQDEIDEHLAETAAWIEEFNDALDDAREHLDTLQDLATDPQSSRLDQWTATTIQQLDDQLPTLDVPEGEAGAPDHPLFDTTRSRFDNVCRADPDRDLDGDGE